MGACNSSISGSILSNDTSINDIHNQIKNRFEKHILTLDNMSTKSKLNF